MEIKANTTYFVRRKGSSGDLGYLNIYGNSYTGDTQPIKLWKKVSTDPMQKWRFDANPEIGAFLCTMCDLTRAINMYSTSTPKCTIWAKANNATDGLVKIVEYASGYYYIRLVNRNLYLTATSTENGTQVTWAAQNAGSSTQLWEFIEEGSSGSSTTGSYTYPTDNLTLSRGFYMRDVTHANDIYNDHNGIDIRPKVKGVAGDAVYAFADGVVARVKSNVDREGYTLRINHDTNINSNAYFQTRYLHLNQLPIVKEGVRVSKGQLIGYMGNTGNSTGVHLHFEIAAREKATGNFGVGYGHYYNDVDYWVNPSTYLPNYVVTN